ncbi:MAG TPA: hypothetical protein VFI84_03150 [Candidatus Saccharimonadales bacterium]|nr:hypothetical protein [Candidatus Saccharimonadales bacterium]
MSDLATPIYANRSSNGEVVSVSLVAEVEPSEANRLDAYYNQATRAANTGESIDPTITLKLGTIGMLYARHEDIQTRMSGPDDLTCGHSVKGTVLAENGTVYQASVELLKRSLISKALKRPIKSLITLSVDAPKTTKI